MSLLRLSSHFAGDVKIGEWKISYYFLLKMDLHSFMVSFPHLYLQQPVIYT